MRRAARRHRFALAFGLWDALGRRAWRDETLLSLVRQALDAVGEPHRTTIALAYFTGLTHTEIAQRMGVPLGTVKSRIRDGVAKMRTHLGGQR